MDELRCAEVQKEDRAAIDAVSDGRYYQALTLPPRHESFRFSIDWLKFSTDLIMHFNADFDSTRLDCKS